MAKANTAITWSFNIASFSSGTGFNALCSGAPSLTTSYAIYECDGDATPYPNTFTYIDLDAPGTGNTVSVAWIGIKPWFSDVEVNGPITGSSFVNSHATLLASSLLGVHGLPSADSYLQLSDNTGSSGTVANFDTNGGLTGLGPSTAPSGACSTNGVWVFSQDGNATYCHSGTWTSFTALAGISGIDFASSPITPSSGIVNFAASSPIVGAVVGNTLTLSCPTCSVGSGTSVSVNGGSGLGSLNINPTTPSADASFLALTPKISSSNMIIEAPYATGSAFGVVEGDSSTLTLTAGVISCTQATSSQVGCAKLGASGGANVYLGFTPAHSGANSDITQLTGLTTPLTVPGGGSGAASFTDYAVLAANGSGTGPFQPIGPGTAGQPLVSGGASAYPNYAASLGAGFGGTGTTSLSGLREANSGSPDTSANGHQVGTPLDCGDTSGSGTAQSCTTSPTFSPAYPDCVTYTTTTANTGVGLTVNINALGAKSVAIAGLSGWTTTLVAGIIPAGTPVPMCYSGTNWNAIQTGTAVAAGSGNTTINGTACALGGSCSPTAPVTITTTSTATLGGTYNSGVIYNQEATAAAAVTYTLPTPAAGKLFCVKNSYNGSAANTGQLELLVANTGTQSIIYNGTISASGYIISGGAAGDYGCVVGINTTEWDFSPSEGTWTLH